MSGVEKESMQYLNVSIGEIGWTLFQMSRYYHTVISDAELILYNFLQLPVTPKPLQQ